MKADHGEGSFVFSVEAETMRDNGGISPCETTDSRALGKTQGQMFAKNKTPRVGC
jgi:hypothetical protein